MTTTEQIETKIERLDSFQNIVGRFLTLLGDPSKYEYRGDMIDLGTYGKGKCLCNHPVRYLFLIHGPNGEVAPVGCECIKHFQSYNDKLYASLEIARTKLEETLAANQRAISTARSQAALNVAEQSFKLTKEKFFEICRLHRQHIGYKLPYAMWMFQTELCGKVEYKTANGYTKYYTRMIDKTERLIERYAKGELK